MGRTPRFIRVRCGCKLIIPLISNETTQVRRGADHEDECWSRDANVSKDLFRIFNLDLVHVEHGRKLLDHIWDIHPYRGSYRDVS